MALVDHKLASKHSATWGKLRQELLNNDGAE